MKKLSHFFKYFVVLFLVFAGLTPTACTSQEQPGDKTNQPPATVHPAADTVPAEVREAEAVTNKAYMDQALELIRSADTSVYVSQLYLNEDGATDWLAGELIEALDRGVRVTVLVNRDDEDEKSRVIAKRLTDAGAEVRRASRSGYGKLHAKLIVADGERLLLGSTNWSANSIYNNNEVNLYVKHRGIAGHYVRWIEHLFQNPAEDPELAASSTKHFRTVTNRQLPELIGKKLAGAEQRIWLGIYVFRTYFDQSGESGSTVPRSNQFARQMARAAGDGVDVRVLLDRSHYSDFINEFNSQTAEWLKERGVEVRRTPEDTISHWKLLVVDDSALVSTMNWGKSGFKHHAEAGLYTTRPEVVKALSDYYLNLWK